MGRYLGKKCKGVVGEKIAVVGVKTRARAALAMAESQTHTQTPSSSPPPSKKIKKVTKSSCSNAVVDDDVRRKNRRRNLSVVENSVERGTTSSSEVVEVEVEDEEEVANCSTTTTTNNNTNTASTTASDFAPSCSSSNYDQSESSSDQVVKDRLEISIADPEVDESGEESSRNIDCHRTDDEAREATTKSDGRDSPARKSTVQIKMPSDSEIEEFFASAEKDLHQRFCDKYNFDVVKEVPLKGRYEWVPIKP